MSYKKSQSILNRIRTEIPDGTAIPKPATSEPYNTKGWGRRRDEPALVYLIPNRSNSDYPYQKGITETEFQRAYSQLNQTGEFTRKWFETELAGCDREGGCNFTTIGGIFELLGEASYSSPGIYKKTLQKNHLKYAE